MDDQKIMLENYVLFNEYHEIAQEVEVLLDCHQLYV